MTCLFPHPVTIASKRNAEAVATAIKKQKASSTTAKKETPTKLKKATQKISYKGYNDLYFETISSQTKDGDEKKDAKFPSK
jgi:hypothetical protein